MTHQLELNDIKRDWIDESEREFRARFSSPDMTFTADELYNYLQPAPHPNWIGCLVARLRNGGLIFEIGRVKSRRPERNGAKISLWKTV